MSRLLPRLLLPAALLLLAAGPDPGFAPPGELWFKVKARITGYAVAEGETPLKGSGTEIIYMRLGPIPTEAQQPVDDDYPSLPQSPYRIDVWVQYPKGWGYAGGTDVALESCDGLCYFVSDEQVVVPIEDGEFSAYVTGLLKVKRDKQGAIASARFTTLGAEVWGGVLHDDAGDRGLRGGLKMSGNSVPKEKLPFSPEA